MTQRRCSMPGCTTILSRYNDEDRCMFHQEPKFRKGSGVIKAQPLQPTSEDLSDEEAARYRRMDWSSEFKL